MKINLEVNHTFKRVSKVTTTTPNVYLAKVLRDKSELVSMPGDLISQCVLQTEFHL